MRFAARRSKALALAEGLDLDSLLINTQPDLRYLCGFTGSAGALVLKRRGCAFFTDGRYTSQAKEEVQGVSVHVEQRSPSAAAVVWLHANGLRRCGLEETRTTVAEWHDLVRLLSPRYRKSTFKGVRDLVSSLRTVKDAEEIETIQRAACIGDDLFTALLPRIEPSRKEAEIADLLLRGARDCGAEGMSFDTIVASGRRSALPHGRASEARLPRRGLVTLDFGVIYKGYCSDMTRTVCLGSPTRRERDVYDSVLEAQQAAIQATRPGVKGQVVDEAARGALTKANLAAQFTHSTGHGVGLEIHEGPRIGMRQEGLLRKGMVITIEPGVYLPDQFGVRIEDMLLLTPGGNQVLTHSVKTLIEL